MHPVRKFILAQLCDYDSRRFSQIKPVSMESSRFMYHLHALEHEGLVKKFDQMYKLTLKGKQFIDKADADNLEPVAFPRVTIAFAYRHNKKGMLLIQRPQQPARGVVGFVLENVPHDISNLQHFSQQRFKKLYGIDTTFSLKANGYIRLIDDDEFVSNMFTHIMYAEGNAEMDTNNELLWEEELADQPIFTSCLKLMQMLKEKPKSQHFFFELEARY